MNCDVARIAQWGIATVNNHLELRNILCLLEGGHMLQLLFDACQITATKEVA